MSDAPGIDNNSKLLLCKGAGTFLALFLWFIAFKGEEG